MISNINSLYEAIYVLFCGEGGIRTHDTVTRIQTFQACSFDHSDTSPNSLGKNNVYFWLRKFISSLFTISD